jgi:hypothetical protein
MTFRAFRLALLALSALVGVAHAESNAANTASPIIIGPLPPIHIGPPPLPWPLPWPWHIPVDPVPIHPLPPLPAPQPIVPGQGCVPTPGTACPG